MTKTVLALVLAAAAAPAGAQIPTTPDAMRGARPPAAAPTPPAAAPTPTPSTSSSALPKREPAERGTVLEEVSGKVADIDRRNHTLKVETASGPVTLSLDRNTMVYTATGLGTVLDVTPGAQIRAGRSADYLAYWVQVRALQPPPSTPGQGTGPAGGGSAPAGESVGPGMGATPAPPTTGSGPGTTPSGSAGTTRP